MRPNGERRWDGPAALRWDGPAALRWSFLAGAVLAFLWFVSLFYLPDRGFTSLLTFGEREQGRFLAKLQELDVYVWPDSHGYDAQYYAQLAMQPNLQDPALATAIDNLPYRARRILLSWTAWALGCGDPGRSLHVYAVQNIVGWLILAVVLLRWFRPSSTDNLVRWAGVMFSLGLWSSVRNALVDGPSLLLIALGMVCVENGRRWWAAVVFGIAGLARETNVLTAVSLLPRERTVRGWAVAAGQGLIVILPLALWVAWLAQTLGTGSGSTAANFALPFVGYTYEWRESLAQARSGLDFAEAYGGLVVILGLTVQLLFFVLRPRVSDPWWRLGAAYLVLMAILGPAVWEGIPGAACRVLLPLTLAFNLLVPRGRWWWPVLMLGNVSVVPTVLTVPPAIGEVVTIVGSAGVAPDAEGTERFSVSFHEEWYPMEQSRYGRERWRWASGSATATIKNPAGIPVRARLEFELASRAPRTVRVQVGNEVLSEEPIDRAGKVVVVPDILLAPGDTSWSFAVDNPGLAMADDPRPLAFMLKDVRLILYGYPKE